jgi:hypothetical protein
MLRAFMFLNLLRFARFLPIPHAEQAFLDQLIKLLLVYLHGFVGREGAAHVAFS